MVESDTTSLGKLGGLSRRDFAAWVQGKHVGDVPVPIIGVILVLKPLLKLAESADLIGRNFLSQAGELMMEIFVDIKYLRGLNAIAE